MSKLLRVLPLLLPLLPSASARTITAATTILIDSNEPVPLQKAASDLADDFQRVFGQRGRIVRTPQQAGPSTIQIALNNAGPTRIDRPTGWENLRIQTEPNGVLL